MHLALAWALAASFTSPSFAHADGWFQSACRKVEGLYSNARAQYAKACEAQMENADCANFFALNDIPMEYRRDCNAEPTIEAFKSLYNTVRRCPQSMVDAALFGNDLIIDPLVGAFEMMYENGQVVSQPARAENYRKAVREQVDYLALPYAEKQKLYEQAQADEVRRGAAQKIIDNALDTAKITLQCYNDLKRTELECYGIGVAIGTFGTFKLAKGAVKAPGLIVRKVGEWKNKLIKAAGIKTGGGLAEAAAKVEKNLGYKPAIQDASRMDEGFVKIQARNPANEEVAMFTGQLKNDGKFLDYNYTNVPAVADRRKGLSELMLSEALARHPKVKQLGSSITEGENLKALKEALKNTASCAEAMTHTPAFKAGARSGFGRVVQAVCEGDTPYMIVERSL
jgi:hypothetical protein